MPEDRNGLDILSEDECFRLLGRGGIGRVGLQSGSLPTILPVTYAVLDRDIVFPTTTGSKLDAAVHRTLMAFEVDHLDPLLPIGWSVVVVGVASEITHPGELEQVADLPLHSWVVSTHMRYVRIRSDVVTGRRLGRSVARRAEATSIIDLTAMGRRVASGRPA